MVVQGGKGGCEMAHSVKLVAWVATKRAEVRDLFTRWRGDRFYGLYGCLCVMRWVAMTEGK